MRNILLAITMLTLLMAGCAAEQTRGTGNPQFTKHFGGSIFKVTEKELFSVEIASDEKTLKLGNDALGIIIHNAKDEDVEGANIQVSVYIPNETSSADTLHVTEKADGLYTIRKIDLRRKGEWELRVKVKKGDLEDAAVFHFPAPGK